ncbi:tat pathway signal sequence protein [Rutstroemia sp. NJR-2017a BBW]|nr:tat pathway signal sequence protein [Rutstroemia sp. NJR-2017a BBW]
MPAKYERVIGDEKFIDVSPGRSSAESTDSTLLEYEEGGAEVPSTTKRQYDNRWMWLVHAVLLSFSFGLFASAYFTRVSTLRHVQEYSAWSPAAKAVEYERVKFNNTMGTGSPYVGFGPEVDRAWRAISYDVGDQMITPDKLDVIGMPDTHLKVKDPKTGVEGYRVGLEVFHQLHCINLLRQVTYRDWYEDISGEFKEGPEGLRMHTDHCLEILRMNVQCNADVGVFTLYMLEGDPAPWPELNSWHVCRNFDAVLDWAMENSVGIMEKHENNTISR